MTASTNKSSFPAGEEPVLTLTVSNTGQSDCAVNVGTSQMEFQVTREGERVFSSVDCQEGAEDLEKTMTAGKEEKANFQWNRTRSVPGCEVQNQELESGDYVLITKLGSRISDGTTFTLQ